MVVLAALLMGGCGLSTPTPDTTEIATSQVTATFYLKGMNQRLKIL